ncbi:MAG TPA: rod shape-determining protein MreC [Sphingobacteriaceae bacterium]|nr:rod shape-determining protein MreC [Sphingobacteriaceae bacterium]
MKNIWILLTKYNEVFLFILFFGLSFALVITNNDFQRSSTFNSSNAIIGKIYKETSRITNYMKLDEANQELLAENAALRISLDRLISQDTSYLQTVLDTLGSPQYSYISAKVTNNSIRQKNNYITIAKGSDHGIEKGMAVISPTGIVGIVLNVSPQYATIQSLLHSDTRVSASLQESKAFGSLIWGDNFDSKKAVLRDIPNHVEVRKGETVITSGYSLFPPGIQIGEVIETTEVGGESFKDISVALTTDFHNLQYVYVVVHNFLAEKQALEAITENND